MKLSNCVTKGRKSAGFIEFYDRELNYEPTAILEIGVQTGDSLRMWKERFPNAKVVGIDVDPDCGKPDGCEVIIGDGHDPAFLAGVWSAHGPFDFVVEDGSHKVDDQIRTFEALFPMMAPGALYACEDLHTSYWPEFAGGETFVGYVRRLLDRMHRYAAESDRCRQTFSVPEATDVRRLAVYPGIAFLSK